MIREVSTDRIQYPDTASRNIVLIGSSLAVFLMTFMSSSVNVALPTIGREFGSDAILLGWIVTAYTLAAAVFSMIFGRLADTTGLKKIFFYGVILFALTSVTAIFSISSTMLIVCRSIQGISAAMFMPAGIALIPAIYPPNERGRPLGINASCAYIGACTGPVLGGVLTEHFGWKSIFYFAIVGALLVILLFAWKIKGEWCKSRGEKLDYPGSVIYGLSLIALIYGLSILPEVRGAIIITGGIIGILVFFKWESLSSSPILNINVLRKNKTFVFSILAILTSFSSVFVASFLLSLYFQYVKGFDPAKAGLIMLAVPVMQAFLSPFTGRLSDKIEPRIVASIGLVLTLIGICFFIFLDGNTPLIQIIVMLLIMGVGNSLFASPNANAIMSSVEPRYLGTASATMNTSMSLGQALSMGIAMMVMAIIIGRVAITPQYYPAFLASTRVAFSVVAVLVSGGIIFSVFRGKIR